MDPDLLDSLASATQTLVVTGASLGVASGLPTFRGTEPDAIWSDEVLERGTLSYFVRAPLDSWLWYLDRFRRLDGAEPNESHHALVRWEGLGGRSLLVTQNIDGLHRAAGTKSLVEVHGRADRVRCTNPKCANAAPKGTLARPDDTLARLRATAGTSPTSRPARSAERYSARTCSGSTSAAMDIATSESTIAKAADAIVFAGTSFSVGVTDMILDTGLRRGAQMVSRIAARRDRTPTETAG